MSRHWRCANGHSWTGELGALTFCPECTSADVYEVRQGVANPPPLRRAAEPITFAKPTAIRSDDTLRQAPVAAGVAVCEQTLVQPPILRHEAPTTSRSDETMIQATTGSSISTAELPAAPKLSVPSTFILEIPPAAIAAAEAETGDFPSIRGSDISEADHGQPARLRTPPDTFVMAPQDSDGTLRIEYDDPGDESTVDLPARKVDSSKTDAFVGAAPQSTGSWDEPDSADATTVTVVKPALPATAIVSPESAVQLGSRAAAENSETLDRPAAPALPAARSGEPKIPQVAGYEILGVLGHGGMGVVYKATQKGLNRVVALKMIIGGSHAGKGQRGRFRAEALAVAKLQHPNIVQVYEVGERDGMPFFSLEYLDGGSLQQRSEGKPLPSRTAAAVVEQLARAMQYAHANGIVHRDLKPANILLKVLDDADTLADSRSDHSSTSGLRTVRLPYIPKITDFGLAKDLQQDSGLTGTGTILGTPSFMSPEQAEGKTREIGPPTDIHALGAILYDSLTGRPPFLGADPMATIMQVRLMEPVPPSRWQPGLPRDLETICLKCLEKSPARRYATAGDLADDLRRFLEDEPIRARPTSNIEKALKWARRRPTAAAFVVLSLATLMGAAIAGATIAKLKDEQASAETARADEQAALRAEADSQRDRARVEAARAQTNFNAAREAMDEFLTRVGDDRLRREPRTERLQAQLLDSSFKFYDRFLKTGDGDDPALRRDAGWAYQRVGRVREMLGRRAEAIDAYRNAVAVFSALVDKQPAEPLNRKGLADSHRQLAIALEADNKRDDAEHSYSTARALLERLVADSPNDSTFVVDLASLLNNRGTQFASRRKPLEAIRTYREALAALAPLMSAESPTKDVQMETARTELNLGTVLVTTNEQDQGRNLLRASVEHFQKLAQAVPEPTYARELGRAIANLGSAFVLAQKHDEALEVYRKALPVFDELAGKFPHVPDYRYELARTHDNIAQVIQATKGRRPAEAEREKARTMFRDLAAAHPDIDGYRLQYALSLDTYGAFLKETSRNDQAIAAVREAIAMLQKIAADDPYDPDVQRHLGQRLLNLGMLLAADGQDADAEALYVQAATVLENALKRWPSLQAARTSLADVYSNQANLMKHLARPAEEESALLRVAEQQIRRAADFPDQPDRSAELARTYFALAGLRMEKPAQAIAALREAYDRQRTAHALAPQRSDLLANLGLYGGALVESLTNMGDHAGAAKTAERLVADLPPNWTGWPKIAGFLSQSLQAARDDKKLSDAERAKAVQLYGTAAIAILNRAIAGGFKDGAALQTMPELTALRNAAEFKEEFAKLLAGIGGR